MKLNLSILFLFYALCGFAGNNDREKTQVRSVTGKVESTHGEAVAGARIVVVETGEYVYSDMDGKYSFSLKTDRTYTISVQSIGFAPLQLPSSELNGFSDLSLKPL